MDESKSFSLNKSDLKKIFKGLALAMGGAGITYLLGILDVINVDWISPLYTGIAAALLNAIKVWIQGQTK